MEGNLPQQILDELLPYLEALDTRSEALTQFLKDKGLTTDEQFASYLEKAGSITNVKWLGARVRIGRMLAALARDFEEKKREAESEHEKDAGEKPEEQSGKSSDTPAENKSEDSAAENTPEKTGVNGEERHEADSRDGPHQPVKQESGARIAKDVANNEAQKKTK